MSSYEAVRRAASGDPGGWHRAMQSLGESGIPDSQVQFDTGHKLWVYHRGNGESPGFHANIWHPRTGGARDVDAYLGDVPEHVGPQVRRMLNHPGVMQHMRGQMEGEPGLGSYYLDMTQER